jgi:hypothetical protein
VRPIALLIVLAIAASASAGKTPQDDCALYEGAYKGAPLFKVKTGAGMQRVYFYSRPQHWPDSRPCRSRGKAYLVPGDVVFGGPEKHGFSCAYYGGAQGVLVAGYLPVENLESIADEGALSGQFLAGTWMMSFGAKSTPNSIEIKPAGPGQVNAAGEAYYQTAQTINEGSFECPAVPVKDGAKELVFREGDGEGACEVTVRRRGPYLVAGDNRNCGGLNVTFEGIYTRTKSR